MTYAQTIGYLFAKLPMYSRIGDAAFKPGLENTIRLCAFLGNPQQQFKSVHVAGTNGKGSVSHMLAAILQSAGYKTGLYTSPHLKDFRERIKVNGQDTDEQFIIDIVQKLMPLIEEIRPSFFEITVAMAFAYFEKQKIDIAIIETGLGGRLDSTNIINPILSVITNIGYDHMQLLGNSLSLIAAEKAGIIKPGVPVIIGETQAETKKVFTEKAAQQNAPLLFADQQSQVMEWSWQQHELVAQVIGPHKTDQELYHLDLPGIYQTKNLLTVLAACHCLQQLGVVLDQASIKTGLRHTKKFTRLHGRWELIAQRPDLILDVSHNEDGIRQLMRQLEVLDYHQVHIVLGMVRDKDVVKVLSLLPVAAHYYFTQAHIPRALPAEALMQQALGFSLKGKVFADVNTAIKTARAQARPDDLVLVCGSVFLIGEVDY